MQVLLAGAAGCRRSQIVLDCRPQQAGRTRGRTPGAAGHSLLHRFRITPLPRIQTYCALFNCAGVDTDEEAGVNYVQIASLLPAPNKRRKL